MVIQFWHYNLFLFTQDKKTTINIIIANLSWMFYLVPTLCKEVISDWETLYTIPVWIMHAPHKPCVDSQANAACQGE